MSGQGIAQILVYCRRARRARRIRSASRMARVYARVAPLVRLERGFYRLLGHRRRREQDWKSYGEDGARLQRPLLGSFSTRSSGCRATCS